MFARQSKMMEVCACRRLIAAALAHTARLAIVFLMVGCTASGEPRRVLTLSASQPAKVRSAPFAGDYSLHRAGSPRGSTVVVDSYLRRGQPVGFRVRDEGIVAVAGTSEHPLESGDYEWMVSADPGQLDVRRTTATVLFTTATVFIFFGGAFFW